MSEINIAIRDADTFECEGKTWRVVALRGPVPGDMFITNTFGTGIKKCQDRCSTGIYSPRLIVTEVKPLHRTPTDEDAKRRPACEYRDNDSEPWACRGDCVLVAVSGDGLFYVMHNERQVALWRQCRIPNET